MQFCEYHNILCSSGATCTKPTARKSASFVLAPLQFSENTTQMQTSRSEQQRGEEVHSIVPIAHVSIAESSVPFKAPLGFNFRRLFPFFFPFPIYKIHPPLLSATYETGRHKKQGLLKPILVCWFQPLAGHLQEGPAGQRLNAAKCLNRARAGGSSRREAQEHLHCRNRKTGSRKTFRTLDKPGILK